MCYIQYDNKCGSNVLVGFKVFSGICTLLEIHFKFVTYNLFQMSKRITLKA
mgnify:CR=1 FL=1